MIQVTEENRKWWIVVAMAAAMATIFVDQTALSAALASIQVSLNTSATTLQWIVNAYLLATTTCLILGGKLGDLLGYRRVFFIGITIFMLSSIACAMATTSWWIILSRVFQGFGAALLMPSTSVNIFNAFQEHERGRAMGVFAFTASLFLTTGPALGGLLTEYLSWRWIFWINIPIGIMSITMTLMALQKSPSSPKKFAFDWIGFFFVSVGIFALVLALMEGINWGWTSLRIASAFAISLLAFLIVIPLERKHPNPFLDIQFFANKNFSCACVLLALIHSCFMLMMFVGLYLQYVLMLSAGIVGLTILVITSPGLFMGPISGMLGDRFGPRLPATLGFCAVLFCGLWIGTCVWFNNYWLLLPGLFVMGFSGTLVVLNTMNTALASVPHAKRGAAAGIASKARQLGSSLGVAVIGAVINNVFAYKFSQFLANSSGSIHQLHEADIDDLLSGASLAKSTLEKLVPHDAELVYTAARSSYKLAFSAAMFTIAFIAILGLFFARQLPKKLRK